jgi:hypothetical protein
LRHCIAWEPWDLQQRHRTQIGKKTGGKYIGSTSISAKARSFMGAEALAKVRFANGAERWIAFGAGLAVLVHPDGSLRLAL